MTLTEIIISIVLVGQFIYLLRKIKMAALDDLKTAITNLDASIDSVIQTLQNLRNQLGNSILASDVEVEITRLQALKSKLDAAQ